MASRGDYNEILFHTEKQGGRLRDDAALDAFLAALEDCGLNDLGFECQPYTWTNNQVFPHTIRARLDRICGNTAWSSFFPRATVSHLVDHASDHLPLLLSLYGRSLGDGCRHRGFKFKAYWMRDEACDSVVANSWNVFNCVDPNQRVWERIRSCRQGLLQWRKISASTPGKQISQLQTKLDNLRGGIVSGSSKIEEQTTCRELESAFCNNDIYWRQRSRIQWVQLGDRNTKFFHSKASIRRRINRISRIRNDRGTLCEDHGEISHISESYFSNLFTSRQTSISEVERITSCILPRVTTSMCDDLMRPYTRDEVYSALSQMEPLKAPGPDGMPALFYQNFWHIVGDDVCASILHFLNDDVLLQKMNYTHIVLIPMISHPESMSHFRPISLMNVIYKIGLKVIANRLKPILQKIISPSQSAFGPRRLITDNVLVAFKINHLISKCTKGKTGFMALKLDMSKVYDPIEWNYLQSLMLCFGFPRHFVDLIMKCVSTVSYSFLLNGEQFGYLTPSHGLRRGDPLSPYLFVLCVEGFLALINHVVLTCSLAGIRISSTAPEISNLCFADDTLLFAQATMANSQKLKEILQFYALASGQEVNDDKSSIVF